MISGLQGARATFLFLTTLSKLIRKPHSEPVILMIPGLDASEGIFLFLTALSELIGKPYLELMILRISRLENSMCQNSLETIPRACDFHDCRA